MGKYNSCLNQDIDSSAYDSRSRGHIDNITMSLYLGGGIRLRKGLVKWVQLHLNECELCAKKLEERLNDMVIGGDAELNQTEPK